MAARVVVLKCENYDLRKVQDTIQRTLDCLGGIHCVIKKGQKVLLKPNMLSASKPERGITTHPIVVEAVVNLIQDAGCEVWIGDSPSGSIKGLQRFWSHTGYLDVAQRTGAKLINFETGGSVVHKINNQPYYLAKSIFEADVVINLPKFKTHGFVLFTGAIKNCYGTLPGLQKPAIHRRYSNPVNFSNRLVDVYSIVRPGLHIMDGILGMEGNGPATGNLRNVGLIMASTDGVALDAVACHLMGFREHEIDTIRIAGERGLGVSRLQDIEIIGENLDNVKLHDFLLPSNHFIRLIPQFLVRWVSRFIWVKPVVVLEKCVGCGICADGCPSRAITMVDGHPIIDYNLCINCLCCNESCPENAMIQEKSWLARRMG